MSAVRLSACVMACDDEETLERCLESLAFADEIIVVVDPRSGDRTEKIASELATRVAIHAYEGDLEQKRYTSGLASGDWVLSIDADEVVTPELAVAIQGALSSPHAAGYEMNRVAWHLGRWVRHGDWHPDWKLRLFERAKARWTGRNPHGRAEVEGAVSRLSGDLLHYSYRDLSDQIGRIDTHSSQAAEALFREGRRARWADLVLRPPARFLRSYVLKRGFLDGVVGFLVASSIAYAVFLKYAKLWERRRRGAR